MENQPASIIHAQARAVVEATAKPIEQIVSYIARHAGKERHPSIRLMALVIGVFVFLVAVPMALGLIGHWVSRYVSIDIPRVVEISLSIAGICAGIIFLLWSITTFVIALLWGPQSLARFRFAAARRQVE